MPNLTTNFQFNKPLVNNATDQDLWGGYLNDNMDSADGLIKAARDMVTRNVNAPGDTATAADRNAMIICDATAADPVPSLPDATAAAIGDGFRVSYKKKDNSGNSVTLTPQGGQTIDGAATYKLAGQNDAITLVSDGANWQTVAFKIQPTVVPSASTTVQGIVQLAAKADVQGGASGSLAVTPLALAQAINFSDYYETPAAGLSPAPQSGQTINHTLGVIPKLAILELICKTADIGFGVGTRVPVASSSQAAASTNEGVVMFYAPTFLGWFVGAGGIYLIQYGGGTPAKINAANWYIQMRAWA